MTALGAAGVAAFICLAAWAAIDQKRREMRRLRASFDALRFNTPEGVCGGDALQVVKRVAFLPDGQYSDSLQARMGETFWYCVGPGKSYWLAMPMRIQRRNGPIEWVVRPLSEQRMRAALAGDCRATALAFGNAMEV